MQHNAHTRAFYAHKLGAELSARVTCLHTLRYYGIRLTAIDAENGGV